VNGTRPRRIGHGDDIGELVPSPTTIAHYELRCDVCNVRWWGDHLLDEHGIVACPHCGAARLTVLDATLKPR
jgi:hypothetical protein